MIDTNINSIVTLISEFSTTCNTLLLSNEIDRALENAWQYASQPNGDPSLFVSEAKDRLGWYYEICTDHVDGSSSFKKLDFKDFAFSAAALTKINMAIEDPPPTRTLTSSGQKNTSAGKMLCTKPKARRVYPSGSGKAISGVRSVG